MAETGNRDVSSCRRSMVFEREKLQSMAQSSNVVVTTHSDSLKLNQGQLSAHTLQLGSTRCRCPCWSKPIRIFSTLLCQILLGHLPVWLLYNASTASPDTICHLVLQSFARHGCLREMYASSKPAQSLSQFASLTHLSVTERIMPHSRFVTFHIPICSWALFVCLFLLAP